MNKITVLVLEDSVSEQAHYEATLSKLEECEVLLTSTVAEALKVFRERSTDIGFVFVDGNLGAGGSGTTFLAGVKRLSLNFEGVLVAASGDSKTNDFLRRGGCAETAFQKYMGAKEIIERLRKQKVA